MGLGVCYPSPRPSREQSVALIHLALDLGVRFFDTADTYCRDERELHYAEELLALALSTYPQQISRLVWATKGGMDRAGAGGRPTWVRTRCRGA
mmetsp:Transcript_16572/g.36244  ORF Transcript_16572/g.36244 Transcript_16572/m.36244 type:complete len:94 (+) Transcript_16572:263-544(+)